MVYINEKKAYVVFDECMDELYKASDPPISWLEIKKLYSNDESREAFYSKHRIAEDRYNEIVEKYSKKLNVFYRRQFCWFLLDYAPTIYEKKKCGTCLGFGLWAIGEAVPMGPMDAGDGCPTLVCPECGANRNPVKKKG